MKNSMLAVVRIRRVLASAIALVFISSGWGWAASGQDKAGHDQPYALLKAGDQAPPLNFKSLSGAPAPTWESLRGQVVILDFWATWCAPCIKAIPELNELVRRYQGYPVQFFSVTYEKEQTVTPFLKKYPLRSQVVLDSTCSMFRSYKAWGIPMVAVVGGDEKIKSVVHPPQLTSELIDEVLSGRAPQVEQATPYKDPKGAEDYFCKETSQ